MDQLYEFLINLFFVSLHMSRELILEDLVFGLDFFHDVGVRVEVRWQFRFLTLR